MKRFLKGIALKFLPRSLKSPLALFDWKTRDFLGNSPQFVKEKVFVEYGIPNAVWIESGTFFGTTTDFLSRKFPHVHSIEPSDNLYEKAVNRFRGRNVTLHHGISEKVLPTILEGLTGDANLWLDGHYSGGLTFEGATKCPVPEELQAIEKCLANFSNLTIFIDDVRCFVSESPEFSDYPSLDFLVNWARRMNMSWRVEHDILIIHGDIKGW